MSMIIESKKKVMEISRRRKLEHFYSLFQNGNTVLDVGVSKESNNALPARNYFLKKYRHDPETYTGLGVQDLTGMEKLYPGKAFIQYPGGEFPFSNNEFDWVFCNAVIEHVGVDKAQLLFLNEMLRVANNVFLTTPYKYFPIESHTNIFFMHWNNKLFYKWCNRNMPGITKENLYLFSYHRLQKLLMMSNAASFSTFKNRFYGITMTMTAICSGKQ